MPGLGGTQTTVQDLRQNETDLFEIKKVDTSLESSWTSIIRPNEPLTHKGPFTFHHEAMYNAYLDASSLRLNGSIQVLKSVNGATPVDLDSSDADKVSLTNFFVHSMIRNASVAFNGSVIGPLSSNDYMLKAHLEKICSISRQSAKHHCVTEGYAHDSKDGDKMNLVADGAGNAVRNKWLTERGGKIGFCAPLHLDLCHIDQYILDMLPISITLTLNEDNFVLITGAVDQPSNASTKYTIKLLDLYMTVRRVKFASNLKDTIEKRLLKENAQYTFTKSVVKKFHITKGQTGFIWSGAIVGKLPHHVTATFVSQDALNGKPELNAFRFNHFKLSEMYFTFNGVEEPPGRYQLDLNGPQDGHLYLAEYGKFLDQLNTARFDTSNLIDHESWVGGAKFCLSADRSPDGCSGFHLHDDETGSMSVIGTFSEALTENVVLVLYASSTETIAIDASRRVFVEGGLVAT